MFSDVIDQYKNLLPDVQQLTDQIQQGISDRRQFESSAADIDSWLNQTEFELAESLKLDDDTTAITTVMNRYEVWTNFVKILIL